MIAIPCIEEITPFHAGCPLFGEEQKMCECGAVLKTAGIYCREGVIHKICTACKKEYYLDVNF